MKKGIIPEGTRDLITNECFIKDKLTNKINNVFSKWGYEEVITPTVEFYSTFDYEDGLKEEQMYKFFDTKGRILVLRPDMTIPIARVVCTKLKDYEVPIRLRYKANVFRVNETLVGKRNEYTDCGIELIGLDRKEGDLEVLVTALEAMKEIGLQDYKIEIGNNNFFNNAISNLNLEKQELDKIAELIERKSLPALESYINNINLDESTKVFFKSLPWLFGGEEVLAKGEEIAFNEGMLDSISYLKDIYNDLKELGYGEYITFDLGMIPGVNYYTGIIFRGYATGAGKAVLNGGRYDNLLNKFQRDEKAIGFSINIDELVPLVKEQFINDEVCLEIIYGYDNRIKAIKKAKELINQNIKVVLKIDENSKEIIVKERRKQNGN